MRAALLLAATAVTANARPIWRADRAMMPALAASPADAKDTARARTPQTYTPTLARLCGLGWLHASAAAAGDRLQARNAPNRERQRLAMSRPRSCGSILCVEAEMGSAGAPDACKQPTRRATRCKPP